MIQSLIRRWRNFFKPSDKYKHNPIILTEELSIMSNLLTEAEGAVSNFWKKLVTVWDTKIEPTLANDEQELLTLLKPLFASAEAAAIQDLVVFIKGVLSQLQAGQDLATLEAYVLNALEVVGGQLLSTAKGLSSNALQALIGLVLAQLAGAATVAAAKAADDVVPTVKA